MVELIFQIKCLVLDWYDSEPTKLKNNYSHSFDSIKLAIWLFEDVIVDKYIHVTSNHNHSIALTPKCILHCLLMDENPILIKATFHPTHDYKNLASTSLKRANKQEYLPSYFGLIWDTFKN